MSVAQMRAYLMKLPYGPSWIPQVEAMSDFKVIAVYNRHIEKERNKS